MCKEKATNSESSGGKVDKRKTLPQLFTPMTAKQAQEASVKARNLRKQMRAQILQAAVDEGIDKLFRKALKSSDLDQMALIEKALKLTGLDFGSSEEAVSKLQVDATTDNKTELSGQIEFVIPTK